MYLQPEVIYALCEHNGGKPFYVGRSEDWHRRYGEHRQSAKTGTEAKYQHIRKLWRNGSDFEVVILEENPGKRYEKYWHYLLGCEYDLTNQKMGDTWKNEMAAQKVIRETGKTFNGPQEYLSEMDREIAEEKARKKAARTTARIRSNSDDTERTLFVGENPHTRFISPGLRALKEKNNGKGNKVQHQPKR